MVKRHYILRYQNQNQNEGEYVVPTRSLTLNRQINISSIVLQDMVVFIIYFITFNLFSKDLKLHRQLVYLALLLAGGQLMILSI